MLRHTKDSGLPVALLLVGLVVSGRAEGQRVSDGKDVVVFENSSIDMVRVYLVDRGSDWLLGRAEPGRVTLLPLPPGFAKQSGGQVSLIAVPFGASRGRGATLEPSPSPCDRSRNLPRTCTGCAGWSLAISSSACRGVARGLLKRVRDGPRAVPFGQAA